MTAFATKLADENWTKTLRGMRLPDRRKLVGEYVLGVSQAESIKNRADPSRPLTVQGGGSITYNADHAVVRSHLVDGFGFKTGIIPNDDATIIVVRKNAGLATQPMIVGCGTAGGAMLGMRQFVGPNTNYFSNGEGANNKGANRALPTAGTIYFEAGVMSRQNPQRATGGFGTLYWLNGGVLQTTVAVDLNIFDRASNLGSSAFTEICIGSTSLNDTINTNTLPVYFVAIYQRALNGAEVMNAFNALNAYYARRGVTLAISP